MKSSLRSNWKLSLSACLLAGLVPLVGISVAVIGFGSFDPAAAVPDVFSTAKSKYEKKDYQGALNDFKALSAKYPTNVLCHYYMALCNQCLSRVGEAKKEYQWVIANDRGNLSSQATTGLNQLSGVNNGSGSGSSGSATAGAYTAIGSSAGRPSAGGQIKMVLDFYTTWCGPCKEMEPAFEAAKGRYKSITFKRYDAEDPANAALVKQFAVRAYPTIVMIDAKGKVLYNEAGGLPDEELAKTIDQVNGK
ncbi:MAG: thioredoxin family protein [Candidatus Melainabacteria bacterium]|nr:thioredoxin family protein [Candidatus Melainabacteria bacterium]